MFFCDCSNAVMIHKSDKEFIFYDDDYGWVMKWIQLSKERGYTQVNNYGISITYCPFCGKLLRRSKEDDKLHK